jgi:membrane associated rhomboid family serine protease
MVLAGSAAMIPLGDESRRVEHFPIITAALIGVNALAFFLELSNGDAFVLRWSVVPHDVTAGRHLETLLTALFMHASWSHIIGNMIFLWAFGPGIENAMNPLRYLAFYLLGGVVSMAAQIAADPGSTIPNLGASGAIAAVMGAFLITYPRDRIRTILFFGIFFRVTLIPAVLLIGFWFLTQLFDLGAVANVKSGGVAYLAHIGGMLFGALTSRLFEDPRRIQTNRIYGS